MTKTLAECWQKRWAEVRNTKKANRSDAEAAVDRLYKAIRRGKPTLTWLDNPTVISREYAQAVPLTGLVDYPFLVGWFSLSDPAQASAIGHDARTQRFRLENNYDLLRRITRLPMRRFARPDWLREMNNFITQFDAAKLALWAYGAQGQPSSKASEIGAALTDVLNECFGIIAFQDTCLLIERPKIISFDELYQLSAALNCALEWRDGIRLYAVNGIVVASPIMRHILEFKKANQDVSAPVLDRHGLWYQLSHLRSPADRVAAIELLGWENFLRLAQNQFHVATCVKVDAFGELHRVQCGNQTLLMVKVINSSPEPTGEFRPYVMAVDHLLRPLPNPRDPNGQLGEPQELTPLNAVGASFGMTGADYQAILGKET